MQGFNMGRYRPPADLDNTLSSSSTTAKDGGGRQATWQKPAQPTVRFELPFAMWCHTCPEHASSRLIGQGTRFNAVKSTVTRHHGIAVFAFRFKHAACGGWIEIRTDPLHAIEDAEAAGVDKGVGFVVAEGAKKRDYGVGGLDGPVDGEDDDGTIVLRAADRDGGMSAARKRKREDVMMLAEGRAARRVDEEEEVDRIEKLKSLRDRDWEDPGRANKLLRDNFRVGRKIREKHTQEGEDMKKRFGLGIEIAGPEEADDRVVSTVSFAKPKTPQSAIKMIQKHARDKYHAFTDDHGYDFKRRPLAKRKPSQVPKKVEEAPRMAEVASNDSQTPVRSSKPPEQQKAYEKSGDEDTTQKGALTFVFEEKSSSSGW